MTAAHVLLDSRVLVDRVQRDRDLDQLALDCHWIPLECALALGITAAFESTGGLRPWREAPMRGVCSRVRLHRRECHRARGVGTRMRVRHYERYVTVPPRGARLPCRAHLRTCLRFCCGYQFDVGVEHLGSDEG